MGNERTSMAIKYRNSEISIDLCKLSTAQW